MNVPRLPSDFIGLSKVMPPLSRRCFMSSTAAAAAGYTLAAGPVRADAIQTDTKGLKAGMADVAVAGGNMPVYFARPENEQNPPVQARSTASSPITGRATARRRPRTPGSR
jgi:carboxymethylenebutenolidase